MKVLHTLDALNRGGTEMLELDVCRNARENGIDLSFVATGGGALESDFRDSGVPFFRFQRRLPVDPAVISKLRSLIRREGFSVVHSHQPVSALHVYLATAGMDVKQILSFHGFIGDRRNWVTTRFLLPRVDACVSCSRGLTEWLAAEGNMDESDFRLIYNGVDRKRIDYHGESLRGELGLAPDALLIGAVAHFYTEKRKDQATLCRAFVSVADKLPKAILILVGRVVSGAEHKFEECRQIVESAGLSNRVFFLGQRDDLAKIISSLDIYVFSSFHEGLPIALMEAMLARKPTILSDIAPHLEVSGDGSYAEVFETGNDSELAEKLTLLGESEDARLLLAERAGKFADETFSIEAHLATTTDLYKELTAK